MIRTQIQLTNEQYEALKNISKHNNISMSEILRKSLDNTIDLYYDAKTDNRINRAKELAGKFGSGQKDLSVNHDYYLTEVYK